MTEILVVDDEQSLLAVLSALLKAKNYAVTAVSDGRKAKELIVSKEFDLMLSDVRMDPINGMELLRVAHAERPAMAVIMLTAYSSIETAIESLKLGAFDYLTKPFRVDQLLETVQRALDYGRQLRNRRDVKQEFGVAYHLGNIVAESPSMQSVCELVKKVAPTDTPVLIYGEPGTGKELVARALHAQGRNKDKEFQVVDCAQMSPAEMEAAFLGTADGSPLSAGPGVFEAASGGSVFLKHIEALPASLQAKVLRILQDKCVTRLGASDTVPVSARVIASSSVDLEHLKANRVLQEDLLLRLSVIPIEVRPLRERVRDIVPLAHHFMLRALGEGKTPPPVDPEVCAILESHTWPGNAVELRAVAEASLKGLKDGKFVKDSLPPEIASVPVSRRAEVAPEDDPSRGKALRAFLSTKKSQFLKQVMNADDRKPGR